jgi:asparagine N-glycosylation enzyme membrane subunit Stt3
MILFGSSAGILVDVNLMLQYVTLVLLIIGYVKRKPFKTHGYIMLSVLIITVVTTLVIMAPRLFITFDSYGFPIVVHSILGTSTIILGALFASRFIIAIRNNRPLTCGTKNMMRLALILWIIPIIAGTMMYITLYL